MPDPTAAEVVPKVILKEAIPTDPKKPAEVLAQRVAQRIDAGSWQGGLQELTQIRKEQPIKPSAIAAQAEQIGIDYSSDGKKDRTWEEQQRYDQFIGNASIAKKYLETGYDVLTKPERAALIGGVIREARLRPTFMAEINAMTPDQQRAFAERILRDPHYMLKVRERMAELLDPKNKLSDDVIKEQDELDNISIDRRNKYEDVKDTQKRLTGVERQLAQFARSDTSPIGEKAQQLEELVAAAPRLHSDIAYFNDTLQDLNEQYKRLDTTFQAAVSAEKGGKTPPKFSEEIGREQDELRRKIRETQNEITRRNVSLTQITNLKREEADLQIQRDEIDREFRTKQAEYARVDLQYSKRIRTYRAAQELRASQEEDLVDGMSGIYRESAAEYFDAQIDAANEQIIKELEARKEQATDQKEKQLYEAVQLRWYERQRIRKRGVVGFRRKETYRPLNKSQIDLDYAALVDGGPDLLLKYIYSSQVNKETGKPYTVEELNDIVKNPRIIEQGSEIARQLLAKRMMLGKLSTSDLYQISTSKWGQNMITNAATHNSEFRAVVEQRMGEKIISAPPGFWSRFGDEATKNGWWFLLLGLPFIGAGVLAAKAMKAGVGEIK